MGWGRGAVWLGLAVTAAACTNEYVDFVQAERGSAGVGGAAGSGASGATSAGGNSAGSNSGAGTAGGEVGGAGGFGAGPGGAGSGGRAGCPPGSALCDDDGVCDSLDVDGNCGACGVTCPTKWSCLGAQGCGCTQDLSCVIAGRTDEAGCDESSGLCWCDGTKHCNPGEHCIDEGDDKWNLCTCGSMEGPCPPGSSCVNDVCVPP